TYDGSKVLRVVTFAVMIGAMVLSIGATGAVVRPAAKGLWWLFGAVVDTAALACLQVLLSLKARAAQEERRRAEELAQAADERTALRAELEALRVDLAGKEEAARAALEPLRAELGTAQGDLAEALARAEALTRKLAAATGRKQTRKPGGTTGRKPATATGRKDGTATAPEEVSDVDAEALVLKYLAEGKSASEAGRLAGLSDSRGRQIARKLAAAAPPGQDPAEGS
ncbi:MAG TPA: hypothetical protein VFW33_00445, partial [Gemmataceae bacterium]|nr:hypothetical protein [Gemmataceae bacterium]